VASWVLCKKTQCKFVSKQAQDVMANSNNTLLLSNILQAGIRPLLQRTCHSIISSIFKPYKNPDMK